jgi:hypothetical protein
MQRQARKPRPQATHPAGRHIRTRPLPRAQPPPPQHLRPWLLRAASSRRGGACGTLQHRQLRQSNAGKNPQPRPRTARRNGRLTGTGDALQQSARTGNLQQLERLLQQGAPVNAADSAGRTPLVLAVMQGHTAVVQRLLAAGANTALIDKDGLNALQHARRLGLDGIAHLIERAPEDRGDGCRPPRHGGRPSRNAYR